MSSLNQITCVCLVVLALTDLDAGQASKVDPGKIDPGWVYVSQPLKWESPPRSLHLAIKTSPAQILVLYPSGQLSEVGCLLLRDGDGKIKISQGDGQVVRVGSWTAKGGSLILTSHVVFRTVQRIRSTTGRPDREPDVEQVLKKESNRLRQNGKGYFVRLAGFDDIEFLSLLANEREAGSDATTN